MLIEYFWFLMAKIKKNDVGLPPVLGPDHSTDSVWHKHMLRPSHYIQVCNDLGVDMIDHNPDTARLSCQFTRQEKTKKYIDKLVGTKRKRMREEIESKKKSRRYYEIFVKTLQGTTSVVDAWEGMSVLMLQRALCEQSGIPEDQQRLIYAGRELEDGYTIDRYGIKAQCTVHLVLKLRGC